MASLHVNHGSAYDGADRLGGGIFWFGFGIIAAAVALMVDMTVDAFLIGFAQVTFDVEACGEGFSDTLIYAILVMSVLTSIAFAFALWRMRAQVGAKAEPHDARWARHLRRSFGISALGLFAIASPLEWLLIFGMSHC